MTRLWGLVDPGGMRSPVPGLGGRGHAEPRPRAWVGAGMRRPWRGDHRNHVDNTTLGGFFSSSDVRWPRSGHLTTVDPEIAPTVVLSTCLTPRSDARRSL